MNAPDLPVVTVLAIVMVLLLRVAYAAGRRDERIRQRRLRALWDDGPAPSAIRATSDARAPVLQLVL